MTKWAFAAGALAGGAGWFVYNGILPKTQGFGKTFVGTPGQGSCSRSHTTTARTPRGRRRCWSSWTSTT